MDEWGYSVYALALDLGTGSLGGAADLDGDRGGVVFAAVVVARRGDERRAFILAIAAVLACTPIVWLHYFSLLLVVVAVARPALAPVWFVPARDVGLRRRSQRNDVPDRARDRRGCAHGRRSR